MPKVRSRGFRWPHTFFLRYVVVIGRAQVCAGCVHRSVLQLGFVDIGVLPSGKARDFDSRMRWFESSYPSHENMPQIAACFQIKRRRSCHEAALEEPGSAALGHIIERTWKRLQPAVRRGLLCSRSAVLQNAAMGWPSFED